METFDAKIMRKLIRRSGRVKRRYNEGRAALRAERIANPPGPGNLRDLKAQADKEVMVQTFEALANDPAHAEDATLYNHLFKKEHGAAAVRA